MKKILFILLAMCICSCKPTQCHTNEHVREYQHCQSQKYGRCVYFKWDEDEIVHCGCYDDRCVENERTLGSEEWLKTNKTAKSNRCPYFWWDQHGTKHCGCYNDRCVEVEKNTDKNIRKIK